MKRQLISILYSAAAFLVPGIVQSQTQDDPPSAVVEHPDCSYFTRREKYTPPGGGFGGNQYRLSALTQQVTGMMSAAPRVTDAKSFADPTKLATIDKYLLQDMQAHGVTPAAKTNDYEFIRRVTLDLTGRIPTSDQVV